MALWMRSTQERRTQMVLEVCTRIYYIWSKWVNGFIAAEFNNLYKSLIKQSALFPSPQFNACMFYVTATLSEHEIAEIKTIQFHLSGYLHLLSLPI